MNDDYEAPNWLYGAIGLLLLLLLGLAMRRDVGKARKRARKRRAAESKAARKAAAVADMAVADMAVADEIEPETEEMAA